MTRIGRLAAAAAVIAATVSGAEAANVSFGLGYDSPFGSGDGAPALGVLLESNPGLNLGPVGFGLGAGIAGDTGGDIWVGVGPTLAWPVADHWAVTASLMAGVYAAGDAGDDSESDTEFRTRLGVSRSIAFPWRLGVAVEHKSNGSIGDTTSGGETIFLTFTRPIAGWGFN